MQRDNRQASGVKGIPCHTYSIPRNWPVPDTPLELPMMVVRKLDIISSDMQGQKEQGTNALPLGLLRVPTCSFPRSQWASFPCLLAFPSLCVQSLPNPGATGSLAQQTRCLLGPNTPHSSASGGRLWIRILEGYLMVSAHAAFH